MEIKTTERHTKDIYVFVSKEALEGIIIRAIAEKVGLPAEIIGLWGKLTIEDNKVGSPEYKLGHKAKFTASVPVDQLPSPAQP